MECFQFLFNNEDYICIYGKKNKIVTSAIIQDCGFFTLCNHHYLMVFKFTENKSFFSDNILNWKFLSEH